MRKIITTLLFGFMITNCFGQVFKQIHEYKAVTPKDNDKFGTSVAINKDYYFIGASLDDESVVGTTDETKSNGGALYVFKRSDNSLHQKLFPSTPIKSGFFGNSVDADDTHLVVGHYYGKHDSNSTDKEGLAHVFTKNTNNDWVETKVLKQSNPVKFDLFGRDVAVSDNYILSTANLEDETEKSSGAGYIFFKDEGGADNWGEQAKLKATDAQKSAYMGWSGDLDGIYAVLGAYRYDKDTKTDVGAAYVFKRTGTTWAQDTLLLPDNAKAGDQLGYDVAIEDKYIAVSTKNASVNGFTNAGKVYLYERSSDNKWKLIEELTSPNPTSDEDFGYKVTINEKRIYVSAKGFNSNTGKVYQFTKVGNKWVAKQIIKTNGSTSDNFGTSIVADGYKVLVGSDEGLRRQGAGYLYEYMSPFKKTTTNIEDFFYASLDWGDYNGDGFDDIIISGGLDTTNDEFADTSSVKLYKNDGNGNFTEDTNSTFYGLHLGAVKFIDVDNDKDLDIVVTGQNYTNITKYYTTVYENNAGVFTVKQQLEGVIYSSLSFGDYDNNGSLDMLVTGAFQAHNGASKKTKIYKNTNGTFTDSGITNLAAVQNGNAAFADIDNDGDLDVALLGADSGGDYIFKIYKNSNTVFTENQSLLGYGLGWLTFADFDSDGYQDILLIGDDNTDYEYRTRIFKNDNGRFTQFANLDIGYDNSSGTTPVQWFDYNNDGYKDILASGTSNDSEITTLYKNNMGTSFEAQSDIGIIGVEGNTTIGVTDFNNDGKQDIAISGWYTNASDSYVGGTFIYKNETETTNQKPAVPTNLSTTNVANSGLITFSWDAPSDDTTPSEGLSYWLEITNSSDNSVVASYQVTTTSWKINLSDGNYAWSVRAIDASNQMSDRAVGGQVLSTKNNNISTKNFIIYPNPAYKNITISGIDINNVAAITIIDLQGKKIRMATNVKSSIVDVSNLSSGIYVVNVKMKDGAYSNQKLIIKK